MPSSVSCGGVGAVTREAERFRRLCRERKDEVEICRRLLATRRRCRRGDQSASGVGAESASTQTAS